MARSEAATAIAVLCITCFAATGCGGGGGDGSTSVRSGASAQAPGTSSASTTTGSSTASTGDKRTPGQAGRQPRSVRQTVDAALMSPEPATACSDEVVTAHYLRVAYGGREGCEQAVSPQSVSSSLGPYEQQINADRATVKLHPSDGTYAGEVITVSLVKESGDWKVDSLKSNAPVGP
jgi:hypothetical protein